MSETINEKVVTPQVESTPRKERFEFILSINDSIVCQRYFRINGYKKESAYSIDLIDAIDRCVNMIDRDLKGKCNDYLSITAPLIFKNRDEMHKWAEKHVNELPQTPMSVLLEETNDMYMWDGEKMHLSNLSINRSDYIPDDTEVPKILKLAFLDNGKEVCSRAWDASVYPRFVRSNIDLSNTKNKYANEEMKYPTLEKYVVDEFIRGRQDLIPKIVHELCTTCSKNDVSEYETIGEYGPKTYNYDTRKANDNYYKGWETFCKKKTQKYFQKY